jgi:integrase
MSRTIRNQRLDSREGRSRLAVRREPYWVKLARGWHLGYRKIATGRGSWIARHRPEDYGLRRYQALGEADDSLSADGSKILSYKQAQVAAEAFFRKTEAGGADDEDPHPRRSLTVADAISGYMADREARGHKGVANDRASMAAHVLPGLGAIPVAKLRAGKLKHWFNELANSPARLRTAPGAEPNRREAPSTPEARRSRRASANRTLAILKACLTHAATEHRLSDEAWRSIKPFPEAVAARIVFLSDEEIRRLTNACQGSFRDLVTAAVLTGCRYSELGRLVSEDFNPDNGGTLHIRVSKGDRGSRVGRHIWLTPEAANLFSRLRAGKERNALLLVRDDGEAWGKSHQDRPFARAGEAARITDEATFHSLRHVYAARLVRKGTPLTIVASQLGHADTRMVEKHYGHLAPSVIGEAVRAAFGELGVLEPDNVRNLKVSG